MGSRIVPYGGVLCHRERANIGELLPVFSVPAGVRLDRCPPFTGDKVLNLKMIKAGGVSLVLSVLAAAPASAQMTWTDKAFLNVNFGVQETSHTLDTSSTFDLYGET